MNENFGHFAAWRDAAPETEAGEEGLDFDDWLSVVVRTLRDFPEARRAIEAALAEGSEQGRGRTRRQ
jgi:hypothetical protein